jgi:hypothetical protein
MRELTVSELHMGAPVVKPIASIGQCDRGTRGALPLNDAKALHTARVMC